MNIYADLAGNRKRQRIKSLYNNNVGWKTADMLNGIEGIMNLTAASGEDLATTSDIVTDALTAFGLKASDISHFADVLAAASTNANTNVSLLGESFKYVASTAGAFKFSTEDTVLALGIMANAGIGHILWELKDKLKEAYGITFNCLDWDMLNRWQRELERNGYDVVRVL